MKNYLGKKVKGFKFEYESTGINYNEDMNKYIGKVGEITDVDIFSSDAEVLFEDGEAWSYPLYQIEEHLVPEYEIGKEYEFSDGGEDWERSKLLAIVDHKYKHVVESRFGDVLAYKYIRQEIKPKVFEITPKEAEEKLTEILGIVTKIKK